MSMGVGYLHKVISGKLQLATPSGVIQHSEQIGKWRLVTEIKTIVIRQRNTTRPYKRQFSETMDV